MALCMLVSTVTTSMMFSGVFIPYPASSQECSEVRILMRCGKISACVLPGSGRTKIRIYACVWTHLRSFWEAHSLCFWRSSGKSPHLWLDWQQHRSLQIKKRWWHLIGEDKGIRKLIWKQKEEAAQMIYGWKNQWHFMHRHQKNS